NRKSRAPHVPPARPRSDRTAANSVHSRPRFRGAELQRESRAISAFTRVFDALWRWVPAFAGTNGREQVCGVLRDSALLDPGQDLAGEGIVILLEHHHMAVAVDSVIAEITSRARADARKKCRIDGHFVARALPGNQARKHLGSKRGGACLPPR